MIIGRVIGHVWATRKEDSLSGLKLMIVQRLALGESPEAKDFVAVDCVSAGIGDRVLVVTGSSARNALHQPGIPVDAAIVGIIDELEISGGK